MPWDEAFMLDDLMKLFISNMAPLNTSRAVLVVSFFYSKRCNLSADMFSIEPALNWHFSKGMARVEK